MPGQGDSDPTEPGYGIDDYADQLVEVMDSLGIDRAAVAGSSVGAFIAVSLAARHPDRVTATGLIELQFRERAFWEGEEMWDLVQRMFSIPTQTREAVAPRFEAEIDDAFVLNWNIDRNKAGTAELLRAMWAIRTYDLKQVVAKLSPPVVAIFGDSGPTVGSLENAKAWLPEQARTVVVEGSGHFLAHDRPDALESELRALLQAATSTASA
jgi:pimeloyl-ACP methyl ester carboxylesterase